jgi:ubiquitin-protein ligase
MSRYQQRILAEIKAVSALESQGIFYHADESNICLGRALIFGPEDSVYHHFPCVLAIEFSP